MTREQFTKIVALSLISLGLHLVNTKKYVVKIGLIYEVEDKYLIVCYDIPKDGCMTIKSTKYNKNFEEISCEHYYSEDDVCTMLDMLPSLKESKLNQEVNELLENSSLFIRKTATRKEMILN